MSHKMHATHPARRLLGNLLLIALSLTAAVALHLRYLNSSSAMTGPESISLDRQGLSRAAVESFQVTGVGARVSLDDSQQIVSLWRQFLDNPKLQNRVDWSKRQTAIAYYHDIDLSTRSAGLIIGYPADRLGDAAGFQTDTVVGGQYLHYDLEGSDTSEITGVWNGVLKRVSSLRAVIERYELDPMGKTERVQMQFLE